MEASEGEGRGEGEGEGEDECRGRFLLLTLLRFFPDFLSTALGSLTPLPLLPPLSTESMDLEVVADGISHRISARNVRSAVRLAKVQTWVSMRRMASGQVRRSVT